LEEANDLLGGPGREHPRREGQRDRHGDNDEEPDEGGVKPHHDQPGSHAVEDLAEEIQRDPFICDRVEP
jgi:hypothetical protein